GLGGPLPGGALAPQLPPHDRRDLGAEQLDRAKHLVMRDGADAELREEAPMTEDLVLEQDLVDDLLRAADEQRAAGAAQRVELLARHGRPAALAAEAAHDLRVGGIEDV